MRSMASCPRCGQPVAYPVNFCPMCANPMSGTTTPPAAMSFPALTVVIVVVLVVVLIATVASLYIMTSGVLSRPGVAPPKVTTRPTIETPVAGGVDYSFSIWAVSQAVPLSKWKLDLLQNGTTLFGPATLAPGNPIPGMGTPASIHLSFTDIGDDRVLNEGDIVVLSNSEPGSRYTVTFLWADTGSPIASTNIET